MNWKQQNAWRCLLFIYVSQRCFLFYSGHSKRTREEKKHKTMNSIENYSLLNWYRIWVTRWAFIFKVTHEARHLITMRFKWHLKWNCVFANAIIHTKTKKKKVEQTNRLLRTANDCKKVYATYLYYLLHPWALC